MPAGGRTVRAIQAYRSLLDQRRSIVMGDFNNNLIWDTPGRPEHQAVVELFAELGYQSVYPAHTGEPQGLELSPTLFWYRHPARPYHVDYCYVPGEWLSRVRLEIGAPDDWLDKSDHMPLTLDLDR